MRSRLLKPDLGDWTGVPSLLSASPQSSWILCLTWETSAEIGHGTQRTKCPVWARRVGNADEIEEVVLTAFTTCTEIQNGEKSWETKIIQAQSVHGMTKTRESKHRNPPSHRDLAGCLHKKSLGSCSPAKQAWKAALLTKTVPGLFQRARMWPSSPAWFGTRRWLHKQWSEWDPNPSPLLPQVKMVWHRRDRPPWATRWGRA